jgi:hypothetical protein
MDDLNRRPRVTLQIPPPPQFYNREDSFQPSQASPYSQPPMTGVSSLQANQANPFLQAVYAQKAGDFMFKQFEGLNRFTKSGLSVGEKSVVWLYTKFGAWSRKW